MILFKICYQEEEWTRKLNKWNYVRVGCLMKLDALEFVIKDYNHNTLIFSYNEYN